MDFKIKKVYKSFWQLPFEIQFKLNFIKLSSMSPISISKEGFSNKEADRHGHSPSFKGALSLLQLSQFDADNILNSAPTFVLMRSINFYPFCVFSELFLSFSLFSLCPRKFVKKYKNFERTQCLQKTKICSKLVNPNMLFQ